jgi:hypothetical protein
MLFFVSLQGVKLISIIKVGVLLVAVVDTEFNPQNLKAVYNFASSGLGLASMVMKSFIATYSVAFCYSLGLSLE